MRSDGSAELAGYGAEDRVDIAGHVLQDENQGDGNDTDDQGILDEILAFLLRHRGLHHDAESEKQIAHIRSFPILSFVDILGGEVTVLSNATTTMPALWAASIEGLSAVSELASMTIASTLAAIMFWICWI